MSQELKKIVEQDVAQYIESAFTRVLREQIDPQYIVEVKGGEFACDDYGTLYKTLYGNSPDCMDIFKKAEQLRIQMGGTGLPNQVIADLIEGMLWIPNDQPDVGYKVKLEGYWLFKPPLIH